MKPKINKNKFRYSSIILTIVIICVITFVFWSRNSHIKPQQIVEKVITSVEKNKLHNLNISQEEIILIRTMFKSDLNINPEIHYLINSPSSTDQRPLIDVFFTYIVPVNNDEIANFYHGILEFELEKQSKGVWGIKRIEIIKELSKQETIRK